MENNLNITAGSISDRGLSEKRPENEDSFLVLEERGLYAVADGVGGAQAGDVASQMAVEILGEAFVNHSGDLDVEDIMRAAIDQANSAIFHMAEDLPQLSSMATTLVALHLNGNIATIGHVGDSRAYRLDHNGNLKRETDDHSVVEEEVRAGRMTPEQAANHPSKNVISRALGAEADVEMDLKTIMVEPGTTFLLCSDGITRHIGDDELGGFLAADADPSEICERLKEVCYDRGAEDNLTAVVVRVVAEAREIAAAASASDGEEATVASARHSYATQSAPDHDDDFSTGETIQIDELDDQSYLMDDLGDDDERTDDVTDYSSSSVVVPAASPQAPALARAAGPGSGQDAGFYPRVRIEKAAPTGGSKLLTALLFLLLGGVLGAAGYYFAVGSTQPEQVIQPPPTITEMKSSNAPLTAFEEGRRLVDKDPAAYIDARAASAREVDDYFLLGRAFMLTGKYWEAKRSFQEARNLLATADPNDSKTLANEIALALAVIESPQATERFTKDVATANAAQPSNTNTTQTNNTNIAAPR